MDGAGYPLHRADLYDLLHRGDTLLLQEMRGPTRLFEAHAEIVRGGEAHERVYRLRTGWTARVRRLGDGRRQIIGVMLPGDLFAVKSLLFSRQPDSIEALTPATIDSIERARLRELVLTIPEIALRVMWQLAEDGRRLHNYAVGLGRGHAEERLAMMMLDLRGRLRRLGLANGKTFRLPLTQPQIADITGLTVVHVNRVLRKFREKGILSMRQQIVTILDAAELQRIARPMQDVYELHAPEFHLSDMAEDLPAGIA